MSKITEKERLFCRYYVLTGNYREAAAKAGYANPEKAARVLGWSAEYGLEDMCRHAYGWQTKNPMGYDAE